MNPVKSKENLIKQMHTQIRDLEEFIQFLKSSTEFPWLSIEIMGKIFILADSENPNPSLPPSLSQFQSHVEREDQSSNFSQSIKKFLVLTQLYILLLFSCGARSIESTSNPSTSRSTDERISTNHFG